MFDARSILDILVRGAGPPAPRGQPSDPGTFRDLLGQLGSQPGGERRPEPRMGQQESGRRPQDTAKQPAPAGGGSLEDLLRTILAGGQPEPAGGRQMAPGQKIAPPSGNL